MAQQAPFKFTVSTPGDKPLAVALSRFAEDLSDFTPYWNDYFLPAWYRSMGTHYATQGASTGARWPELSPAYKAWKQKHWPGLPTGVLSGTTRDSLTVPGDPNAVLVAAKDQLTVGTRVPYAIFLQLGTQRSGHASGRRKVRGYEYGAGGGMPARPPLRVSQEFVTQAGRLLQEFGVKAAKAAQVA